ncbi:unnamed protein product [Trichogramma brassicae]|uniref:Uncharacterized protein n=1 Tax=Trichogramma brassicae TaxID=86971 RepID=A0A6H5IM25_9HYME|nr:unnamed protein product [Trichogramma brassicae]
MCFARTSWQAGRPRSAKRESLHRHPGREDRRAHLANLSHMDPPDHTGRATRLAVWTPASSRHVPRLPTPVASADLVLFTDAAVNPSHPDAPQLNGFSSQLVCVQLGLALATLTNNRMLALHLPSKLSTFQPIIRKKQHEWAHVLSSVTLYEYLHEQARVILYECSDPPEVSAMHPCQPTRLPPTDDPSSFKTRHEKTRERNWKRKLAQEQRRKANGETQHTSMSRGVLLLWRPLGGVDRSASARLRGRPEMVYRPEHRVHDAGVQLPLRLGPPMVGMIRARAPAMFDALSLTIFRWAMKSRRTSMWRPRYRL